MNIKALGIDLAKNVFQLHGIDGKGHVLLQKKISRGCLTEFIANLPQCIIFMEACSSANYWSRQFELFGHVVKLISPQYVKPYVKHQKNDKNDAAAIVEAGMRPSMNFVPRKSIEQQDLQCLHRIRSRLVKNRTALINQIRGLLSEYGIIMAQHVCNIRTKLPVILEDASNELTEMSRAIFWDLYDQLTQIDKKIVEYEGKLKHVFKNNEVCQRLAQIEGIGLLTATAIVSTVADAKVFKNGRHFAAFLGLVPRQHSSGNRQQLLGISKHGDTYLRTLLVHGARSALRVAHKKTDGRNRWVVAIKARRGENIACVALANKQARTVWALLAKNEEYKKAA